MNYNYALTGIQKRLFELFQVNVAASNGRLVKHRKVVDPIIQALDALKYKTVIKACTKALEKPSPVTASTLKLLKAVALFFDTDEKSASIKLLRSVCQDESIHGLGDLSILKFLDVLSPLILPSEDILDACDRAAKAYPDDVDLTLFVLNLLLSRNAFDKASKLALKLHSRRSTVEYVLASSTPEAQLRNSYYRKRYLLIAIAALLMQAKTSPNAMLLDLADAYLSQYTKLKESIDEAVTPSNPPFSQSVDIYGPGRGDVDYTLSEFWLRVKALELRSKLGGEKVEEKRKELLGLFETSEGEDLRNRHLGLELWAKDLILLYGGSEELQKLYERMVEGLKDGKDGNWHSINSLVQAADKLDTASLQDQGNGSSMQYQGRAKELLQGLANDAKIGRERGFTLGLVYLAKASSDLDLDLVEQIALYFERFGSKSCCAADLASAIEELSEADKMRLQKLLPDCEDPNTVNDLYRLINRIKIQKQLELPSAEGSSKRALRYAEQYLKCLSFGANLPLTDLQPADDLALFAVEEWLTEASRKESTDFAAWEACMLKAVSLCDHGVKKSPYKFQFRVLLIQLYRLLGAPSLALQHYGLLNPKSIQQDSISHLFMERCSTFSLAFAAKPQKGSSTTAADKLDETLNANASFYHLADRQALETNSRIWNQLTFIKIEEYSEFSQRLVNSIARAHLSIEQYRQQTLASGVVQDLPPEMQDIALAVSENRDFSLVPSREACAMGPSTGPRWNVLMAKVHWSLFADEESANPQTLTEADLTNAHNELSPAEIAFVKFILHLHLFAQTSEPSESDRIYKLLGSYFDEASHEVQTALKAGSYNWKILHTLHLSVEACVLLLSVADGQSDLAFVDAQGKKTSKLMKKLKPLSNNARTACRTAAMKLVNQSSAIKPNKFHEALEPLRAFDTLNNDAVCEGLIRRQQAAARDAGKAVVALFG